MSDTSNIISASDATLKNIYAQNLPILLYLHTAQSAPNAALLDAFNKLLKKHSEQLVIVTLNTDDNPTTAAKYQHLKLPALVTMEHKLFGIREHAQAEDVRIADVRAYAAYLLGQGEDPAQAKQREAQKSQKPTPAGTSDVTDSTFKKQVLKSDTPVLVDFWAPWCGPCQQVSPMLEQLGREYQGKIRVVKVNVDENPALSRKYNIQSIPAMMIFKGGAIMQTTHGAQPKHIIEKMIRNSLD